MNASTIFSNTTKRQAMPIDKKQSQAVLMNAGQCSSNEEMQTKWSQNGHKMVNPYKHSNTKLYQNVLVFSQV